jgi:hypothetical protein
MYYKMGFFMVKKTKKRSGAYSRRKGHSFERETAIALRPIFPEARRQLEYHSDDAKGIDIQNTDEYKIQCKCTAKYVSLNTIKEIQCDRFLGDIPILVAKASGEETLAVLPWEDLIKLIAIAKEASK